MFMIYSLNIWKMNLSNLIKNNHISLSNGIDKSGKLVILKQ